MSQTNNKKLESLRKRKGMIAAMKEGQGIEITQEVPEPPPTTTKAKPAAPREETTSKKKKLEIVMRQNVGFTQEDIDALDRLEAKLAQDYGIRRMGTARAIRFALRVALDETADPKAVAESIKQADGRHKKHN